MRSIRLLLTATFAALVLPLGISAASADPAAPVTTVSIEAAATGDLQNLCDQFSTNYNDTAPSVPLECWQPGASDPKCTTLTFPTTAGAIINDLRSKGSTGEYCLDLGFIDRNLKSTDGAGLVTAIFAKDLITWAANVGGNAVPNLSATDLTAIYECNASLINSSYSGDVTWNEVGGTSTDRIEPVLPQASSGVRAQWLLDIGVTTPGACVINGTYNGNLIPENEGDNAVFTAAGDPTGYKDVMVPYAGSAYVCQVYTKGCPDVHGTLALKNINGKGPVTSGDVLNVSGTSAFPAVYVHGEYGVTLNAGTAAAPKIPTIPINLTVLLGQGNSSGWICSSATAKADIEYFGFATTTNCGALTGQ
jgi:hypothetical protein